MLRLGTGVVGTPNTKPANPRNIFLPFNYTKKKIKILFLTCDMLPVTYFFFIAFSCVTAPAGGMAEHLNIRISHFTNAWYLIRNMTPFLSPIVLCVLRLPKLGNKDMIYHNIYELSHELISYNESDYRNMVPLDSWKPLHTSQSVGLRGGRRAQ